MNPLRNAIGRVACFGMLAMVNMGMAAADRAKVLEGMRAVMGDPPARAEVPPLDVKVADVFRGEGYERRTISVAGAYGERVTAYLYVPAGLKEGERRPGVLALHPTGEPGKAIVDGQGPKLGRGYGMELAMRGYVVVAPDYPSFGEQKDYDFKKSRYASGTMKAIADNVRCVDLLESMPEVDGEKIAAIGHSLGGHNALFTAAFDSRIKVVVTSCGWTPFHYYYGGKELKNWAQDRYMPRVRDVYGNDPDRMPFDFPQVIADAIAPRAVFSNSPVGDANFDVAGVRAAESGIRQAYEAAGVPGRFVVRHPDYGHDFGDVERREAYRFIDRQFGFVPAREVP
jgi:acetyl esterase/lipase